MFNSGLYIKQASPMNSSVGKFLLSHALSVLVLSFICNCKQISISGYKISYGPILCDEVKSCPKWLYCDSNVLKPECRPCTRCNGNVDNDVINNVKCESTPTHCLQSITSATELVVCPPLSVRHGATCHGNCHPVKTTHGSPLGTQCALACDDLEDNGRMLTQNVKCIWSEVNGAYWDTEQFMPGITLENSGEQYPLFVGLNATQISIATSLNSTSTESFSVVFIPLISIICSISVIGLLMLSVSFHLRRSSADRFSLTYNEYQKDSETRAPEASENVDDNGSDEPLLTSQQIATENLDTASTELRSVMTYHESHEQFHNDRQSEIRRGDLQLRIQQLSSSGCCQQPAIRYELQPDNQSMSSNDFQMQLVSSSYSHAGHRSASLGECNVERHHAIPVTVSDHHTASRSCVDRPPSPGTCHQGGSYRDHLRIVPIESDDIVLSADGCAACATTQCETVSKQIFRV